MKTSARFYAGAAVSVPASTRLRPACLARYRVASARASVDNEGAGQDQGRMGLLGLGDPLALTPA